MGIERAVLAASSLLLVCTVARADGTEEEPCLRIEDFRGPEYCATCHPRHYLEWRGSAHAYASIDPVFLACNRKAQAETDGELGTLCLGCHSTIGVRSGQLDARADRKTLDEVAPVISRGVSCEVCHRMEPPPTDAPIGNASFEIGDDGVFYGRLRNPAANAAHDSEYSNFHGESRLCGSCHDVIHENSTLEKSFVEWSASPYNEEREIQCQDCHMLRYSGQASSGGPFRETLRRHNFPAVTLPLIPFPNRGYQQEEIRRFIKTAVRMVVLTPREVTAGGSLRITVLVKNSGAGHNVPSGISTFRQMWLEVTVETVSEQNGAEQNGSEQKRPGEVLYRSGDLDGNGDLRDHRSELDPRGDSDLVSFNDRFLDAEGREVLFMWEASRLEERSLRPLEERSAQYAIEIPRRLLGRALRVRVRLLFRPFAPFGLRELGLPELVAKLPLWEMDSAAPAPVRVVERVERRKSYRVPGDFTSLQEALDALTDGDRVLVAPGEYVLSRRLDFRGKGIAVESEAGAERTVLSLSPRARGDALSVVVFTGGEGNDARLEGFTIRGGAGTLVGRIRQGGGVYVRASSPTLRANHIVGNRAAGGFGGGICIEGGRPVLEQNEIRDNWATHGGGLAFRDRRGPSGIEPWHLIANRWEGNVAENGGGIYLERGSHVILERNVIAGNFAWDGGAGVFVADGAELVFEHSTVVGNESERQERGLLGGAGTARARSSVFWNNNPFDLDDLTLEYSIVDREVPRESTNRSGFPLFVDPTGLREQSTPENGLAGPPLSEAERQTLDGRRWPGKWIGGVYRLLPKSLAIDSGDPDGPADPDDSLPDMGAFFLERPLRAFVRGDTNGDGRINTPDLVSLVQYLDARRSLPCFDAADFDDDGQIVPLDAALLASHVLVGVPVPAMPFPACGLDPTFGEGLSCQEKAEPCLASER